MSEQKKPSLQSLIDAYENNTPRGNNGGGDQFKKSSHLIDLKPYENVRRTNRILDLAHDFVALGWHSCENHRGTQVRWSGPVNVSILEMSMANVESIDFDIAFPIGLSIDDVELFVNGHAVDLDKSIEKGRCVLKLDEYQIESNIIRLKFNLKKLVQVLPDKRLLGICVSAFTVDMK
ncbi:hypothetical protein [Ideonella paludis]|uniref:Uncharacterized protein n=1 Tax=Ideonella paludis TaxID=1233411 RepID=A0ABS5DRB0_9BURK|nr:hypothetical protein [Ideonella paludis]MBQ0933699.1 hypothetical protein [Ideonella paludis]